MFFISLIPFQTKCKCQKIRIFWRNFFASKNHVAEFFWQILCMTLHTHTENIFQQLHPLSSQSRPHSFYREMKPSFIRHIHYIPFTNAYLWWSKAGSSNVLLLIYFIHLFWQLTFPGLSEEDRILKDSLVSVFSGWHGTEVKATLSLATKAALSWRDSPTLSPPFSCTLYSWLYFLYFFFIQLQHICLCSAQTQWERWTPP